ncbi:hypothetical protein [Streptomyces sp. NPDC014746]|uniref:hypothetical protein n=1 Tax=Streptomyces sp. NPDC014746 TaxID=3364904 RepID=UPI0036F86C38
MGESVPVRCPECLRTRPYAPPAFPCSCGSPVAPTVAADQPAEPIRHRTWADAWVTVRCAACGHEHDWPHPEMRCPCGTVLRIPVRAGAEDPAGTEEAPDVDAAGAEGAAVGRVDVPGAEDAAAGAGGRPTAGQSPEELRPSTAGDPATGTPSGTAGDPATGAAGGSGRHRRTAPGGSEGTADGLDGTPAGRGEAYEGDGGTGDGGTGDGGTADADGTDDEPRALPGETGSPWFGPGPRARGGTSTPESDPVTQPTTDPDPGPSAYPSSAPDSDPTDYPGSAPGPASGSDPVGPRSFAERYPVSVPPPVTAPHPAPVRGAFRPVTIRTSRDAVAAAAGYLRWLGFRDVVQPEERPASGVDLRAPGLVAQVDPSTRPAGLRAVECLWLNGLTSATVSVFFSLAGYTPEAHTRAAEIGLPLFVLDLTGTPQPVNDAAQALTTGGA